MRSTSLILVLSTALSAHAALLFPRQDSSSLDSVYASLESFSQEVAAKIGSGECVESDSCAGWLNGALECISGKDESEMASCACDGGLKNSFDTCVTCVGSDSATQTGQAFTQVCSSLSNGSTSAPSLNESATSSAPSQSGTSSSGSATSAPTSSSSAGTSSAAQPSASTDQGSGANKFGGASIVGAGIVGVGLIGMLM
ncbi:hypothetical protein JCM5353_008731 [Sporobolomyces roseus]